MSGITENRIVRMVFDNATFKKAAADTKQSLDYVNQAITNAGKNSGLLDVGKDMDAVKVKAGKMQVAVLTAVGTIANKLTNAALTFGKSMVIDPVRDGFHEYEELLNKQRTLMNASGKSAGAVKKVLADLNTYSDKTIYHFSDMTSAITRFVNAGIKLGPASTAVKGIANAAAYAGASADDASRAMNGFAQAISTGYLGLQDFMQIENANIATKEFKQQLIDAAVAAHELSKVGSKTFFTNGKGRQIEVTTKSLRNQLREKFITDKVLTAALSKYAISTKKGDLADKAFKSAQQVKTFTAFIDTFKESIGSGFANVFTALIGGLEESTKNFTALSNAVGNVVQSFFGFITTSLVTWRQMGGFTKTMQGFRNILSPIGALFTAIGDAWRAAFPNSGKGAGATLYGLSYAFELLTRPLLWLSKLIALLVHPLTLIFQVIRLGGIAVGGIIHYIVEFAKAIWDVATFKVPSTGGFWDFVQKVGGWAKIAAEEIKKLGGEVRGLTDHFSHMSFKMPKFNLPKLPGDFSLSSIFGGDKKTGSDAITNIRELDSKITNLASTISGGVVNIKELEQGVGRMATKVHDGVTNIKELEQTADSLKSKVSDGVTNIRELEQGMGGLSTAVDTVQEKGSSFMDVLRGIVGWVKDLFGSIEGKDITSSLNFAVLATMGVMFAKFLYSVTHFLDNFSKIGASAAELLDNVGGALKSFQTMAKAKLILNIAIALGILAASLWVLSRIPEDKLMTAFKGLAGIIVAFSVILFAFQKTVKALGPSSISKIYALGAAMAMIGIGMLAIAGAMMLMKNVGIGDMIKTLVLLEFLFLELQLTGKLAAGAGRKMVAASLAMIAIGVALGILATSMLIFKLVKPSDMVKAGLGLLAMTTSLLLLSLVPPGMLLHVGAAMLALSISMGILAVALIMFAAVHWWSIAKAALVLILLTAAIIAIAIFGGGPAGASAIVALAAGVLLLSLAMLVFNKVSWNAVAKGSVVLLALVAAFALFMVVVYLAAPVIPLLTGLAFGLGALAIGIALLVLALSAALPLMALGVGAFAAFATGAAIAIAVFLQTLAQEAPVMKTAGIKILQEFVDGIVESIPIILDGCRRALKAVWDFFAGPTTTDTGAKGGDSIMRSFQKKLQEWTPKILQAGEDLIVAFMKKLRDNGHNIGATAGELIAALIRGIASKIDDIVAAAGDLIVAFLGALGDQSEKIATAGLQLIVDLIDGLSGAISTEGPKIISAMSTLGKNIVDGLSTGIGVAAHDVVTSPLHILKGVIGGLIHGANEEAQTHSPSKLTILLGMNLVDGLTVGIQSHAAQAIAALGAVVSGQIALASSYISGYVQKLDQQAIAARAKTEGLSKAAELAGEAADKAADKASKASEAAGKTKSKADDKAAEKQKAAADKQKEAADKLKEGVDKQQTAADKAQETADKARDAVERQAEYNKVGTLEKAKMRSEDAQRQIDDAKAAEEQAAKDIADAKAVEAAAKAKGVSSADKKRLTAEAKQLRADAKKQADLANLLIAAAKTSTADALTLQKQAGAEAAAEFQKQFDAEAQQDAKDAAFEAMTDAEKAASRRAEAAALQAQANTDLQKAKTLAYTDIDAANELAQKANEEADKARDYLKEAIDYEKAVADAAASAVANAPATSGPTLDLTASDAAAIAFNNYAELYSSGMAAAAAQQTVEFNQYNTSPEALSPTEVYRQTNNLLTQASDKLAKAA